VRSERVVEIDLEKDRLTGAFVTITAAIVDAFILT
jgi:hypothetical protein